jgi:hypothetical protein
LLLLKGGQPGTTANLWFVSPAVKRIFFLISNLPPPLNDLLNPKNRAAQPENENAALPDCCAAGKSGRSLDGDVGFNGASSVCGIFSGKNI